jgi:hypothetical protein
MLQHVTLPPASRRGDLDRDARKRAWFDLQRLVVVLEPGILTSYAPIWHDGGHHNGQWEVARHVDPGG